MNNMAQNTLERVLSSFDEEDLITAIVDMHAKEIANSESEIDSFQQQLKERGLDKDSKKELRSFIKSHKALIRQHYKVYDLLGGVRTINDSLIDPYE
jgi:hypothetical protein